MRLTITGANGQLGRCLRDSLGGNELLLVDLPEYDVTEKATAEVIAGFEPDLVIHAAAMTNVDGCEKDPDKAYKVNALGTHNVALACQQCGAVMLYVSTDYVFDGTSDEPYLEYDEPHPLCVYGKSKLAGEESVRDLLSKFYIVRTAWLYGRAGDNFVEKVLALAERQDELLVVDNEFGSPTYAPDLAQAIASLVSSGVYGIYHLTNEGTCSRYEFAATILEFVGQDRVAVRPTRAYARVARVPRRALLRNFSAATQLGIVLRPWKEALRAYFAERDGA
jgi:dTDP-4-dehydrorhamnose reductase